MLDQSQKSQYLILNHNIINNPFRYYSFINYNLFLNLKTKFY